MPTSRPGSIQPSRELQTWKEIAEYLSVTARTAQSWERDRGLPVRRLPGGRGRVLAFAREIDEWKAMAVKPYGDPEPRVRPWRRIAAVAAVVVVAAALSAWVFWTRPSPSGFRIDGATVVALDGSGHDLWRFPLPDQYHCLSHQASSLGMVHLADLDGDGRQELLVNTEANHASAERNALLICLSSNGRELWRFSPGRRVHSPVDDFPLPYRIPAFGVLQLDPTAESKVIVSSHQLILYASQVALLNARTGLIEREYWHSGALQRLLIHDANGDARPEIYLGGIHNASKQATLVVLDPQTMDGASVEGNPNYQLAGFKPGNELGRAFFPTSCHTRKLGQYNVVTSLRFDSGGLEVQVLDPIPGQDHVTFHYFLRPDLSLSNVVEGDNYRGIHDTYHASGFLDHDLSDSERAAKREIHIIRPPAAAAAHP